MRACSGGRPLGIIRAGRIVVAAGLAVVGPAGWALAEDPVVFKEQGKASFYGPELQGQTTASGAKFDQRALTAAHPELPLGSSVTVTNPATGKQVEVEVNDRGPYARGRSIDLSKAAARKLGIVGQGVATVEIEATKEQVEQAIESPDQAPKVKKQLNRARKAAAADGTPQPKLVPLTTPQGP